MRRLLFVLCLILVLPAAAGQAPVILVVGDSLSSGYGIGSHPNWVQLLQQRLDAGHYPYRVVNDAISGDTSLGGRERLPAALKRHHPTIVIIELGGNDGLRALAIDEIHRNLAALIELARTASARVLLVGIQLPPNYGSHYTEAFRAIYPDLAQHYRVPLVPFLLAGVATHPQLMQPDGIHANAAAQPRLLDNVWPYLRPLLGKGP